MGRGQRDTGWACVVVVAKREGLQGRDEAEKGEGAGGALQLGWCHGRAAVWNAVACLLYANEESWLLGWCMKKPSRLTAACLPARTRLLQQGVECRGQPGAQGSHLHHPRQVGS